MPSSPLAALSAGIKQNQDEAVEAGKSIRDKYAMAQSAGLPIGKSNVMPASPAMTPKAPASPMDKVNPGARFGNRPGEKRPAQVLGSYKKGGKVKKTGVYKLHAKERVLNAKQTAKMEKKGGMAAVLGGK